MSDLARDQDIFIYGASGFVGALTAKHLAEHAPPDDRVPADQLIDAEHVDRVVPD